MSSTPFIFPTSEQSRRVLIASSHPLFAQGLRSLLEARAQAGVNVVGIAANLEEVLAALDTLNPDLVIVDYDDEALNRDEFLARFVERGQNLRVVLLSLHSSEDAIVYDRRTLEAARVDDWLETWHKDEAPLAARQPGRGKGKPAKTSDRRNNMKHLVIAGIIVLVVSAVLIAALQVVPLLPAQAALQAVPIDNLFKLEFIVIAFLFSLIVVLMVYSIIVFRRRKGDTSDAAHIEGNTRLEVAWTVAPLATVLVFAFLGGRSLSETMRSDPQAMEINVIASQWSWRFEYPDTGIVAAELVLPVSRQALLHLSSTDVIHSFWVPEFRVKQDALPGGKEFVRDLRITPTVIGGYKVRCAELCGLNHAYMEAPVRVVSQADYDAWVAEQTGQVNDPVGRGAKLSKQYGCLGCHSVDGSKLVGPTWKGLAGNPVTLADGSSVTADEAYLLTAITNPGGQIVQGYTNIMPNVYKTQLSETQINDIIAYIKSLK